MHMAIVAILLALAWTLLEDRQGRQDDLEDFMNIVDAGDHGKSSESERQND